MLVMYKMPKLLKDLVIRVWEIEQGNDPEIIFKTLRAQHSLGNDGQYVKVSVTYL